MNGETMVGIYRDMLRASAAERWILRLVDSGDAIVLYHSGRGQEAVSAGAIAALQSSDYLFYSHRGVGQLLAKGVPPVELFGDVLATTAGSTGGLGAGIVHTVAPDVGVLGQSGTVGGTFVLAAGAALSAQYRDSGQVVMCMFGDGTANRGTFHEAANAAGVWRLPLIWLCENNGYSVSVPITESTPIADLATRAAGYGMPGVIVDGQDAIAVHDAVADAVERARSGGGPTFIEAKTTRFRGHFEGDPQLYRPTADHERFRDPIELLAAALVDAGYATTGDLDAIAADADTEMGHAAEQAKAAPMPDRDRLFEGLLA